MNWRDIKDKLHTKVLGERSLTLGEIICFIIFAILLWKPFLGAWSKWVGLIVLFVGMAIF